MWFIGNKTMFKDPFLLDVSETFFEKCQNLNVICDWLYRSEAKDVVLVAAMSNKLPW